MSLKSWGINGLVHMNYILLICVKKQYTSFLPEYFNVIYAKSTSIVKTDCVTCDHQYRDFYKTHEHSLVTWGIAHFEGTVLGVLRLVRGGPPQTQGC